MKYEVGEKYLVPCVRNEPVLLPAHKDEELCVTNAERMHYHLDWRFKPGEPNLYRALMVIDPVEYREMYCYREEIPRHDGFIFASAILIWRYRHKRVECGLCPHKKLIVQENGLCTGHGLRWKPDGTIAHEGKLYFQFDDSEHKFPVSLPTSIYTFESDYNIKELHLMCGDEIIARANGPMGFYRNGDQFRYTNEAKCDVTGVIE